MELQNLIAQLNALSEKINISQQRFDDLQQQLQNLVTQNLGLNWNTV